MPDYIERFEIERAATGSFFSSGRFFRSRYSAGGYRHARTGVVYFVTSEQFRSFSGELAPRRYTVRRLLPNGTIETAPDHRTGFQYWATSRQAMAAARTYAAGTLKCAGAIAEAVYLQSLPEGPVAHRASVA